MTDFKSYRRRQNSVLLTISGLSIALLVSACGSNGNGDAEGEGGDELVTVDMAISTSSALSAAPIAVANELGYFEEEGCQIGESVEGQGGADPFRAVIDGGLDMGEVATNAAIEGYQAGATVTVVGSGHQLPYDFTFAVQPDSGINSVEDMEGKTWGYTNPGSASEDLAYLLTEAAGISLDSVEFVPTSGMGGGIAMLEGGEVDAALMIPLVYETRSDEFDLGFEALDVIDAYQKTVYIASEEFAEQNPEAVRCVLGGVNRGMQFIQEDPQRAAEIYAAENEDYEVEALVEDMQFANERDTLSGGVGFNAVGLANVERARELRTGEEAETPWDEIFDPQYLPEGVSTELPGGQE